MIHAHPNTCFFVLGAFDYQTHLESQSLEEALAKARSLISRESLLETEQAARRIRYVRYVSEIDSMGDVIRCHQVVVDMGDPSVSGTLH